MSSAIGGFTFAEDPGVAAPQARLIWHAGLDPGVLQVDAVPVSAGHPEAFDPRPFRSLLAIVSGPCGTEHAVISDGMRRIRLDIGSGTLRRGPVLLTCRITGMHSAVAQVVSLQRLVALSRYRRLLFSQYPSDPRMRRMIEVLRVHDGLRSGASQREIAEALCGAGRVATDWHRGAGSLRSRIRRLVAEARLMAEGGYRRLMQQ